MKNKRLQRQEQKRKMMRHVPWKIILFTVTIILLFLIFDPKMSLGGDNCHYMSLANSILHKSYKTEALIGTPPEVGVTPGFPFVLSISLAIFGRTFVPAKVFSFACFIGALWLFWKILIKAGLEKRTTWLILAFGVFNTAVSEFSHWELTEAPFMLISAAAIYFYFASLEKNKMTNLLLTIVLVAAAFYIRTAGICLPIAIGLAFLAQKKWKEFAIYTLLVAILFFPWFIRYITVGGQVGGGTYLPYFTSDPSTGATFSLSGFVEKMLRNFSRYSFTNLPSLFLPILNEKIYHNQTIGYLTGGLFLLLIVLGIVKSVRSKLNFYSIYIILQLLILISFAEHAALVRYLVVIFPFLTLFLIIGAEKLLSKLHAKKITNYSFAIILIIVLFSIPTYIRAAKDNTSMLSEYFKGDRFAGYDISFIRFIEANEWLKTYDSTRVGVISRKPTLTWWFSGHPSQGYKLGTPDKVKADIDSLGAKYVIIDQIFGQTAQFLLPAVRAFPQNFNVIHVTKKPETYVLEVSRDSAANP